MADFESFSTSMVELEKEMAEVHRHLSEENQRARKLEISGSFLAKTKGKINRDIHTIVHEICVLEMEAEDLASLDLQEQSAPTASCPGRKVP